ncbi:hypothetical protein ANTQUA_LOCUS4616 [Anthophora quadrimaculata]
MSPPPSSSVDPPPPCGPIYFPEGLPLSPLSFLSRLRQPVSAQTVFRKEERSTNRVYDTRLLIPIAKVVK